jgi:hypothetical protein
MPLLRGRRLDAAFRSAKVGFGRDAIKWRQRAHIRFGQARQNSSRSNTKPVAGSNDAECVEASRSTGLAQRRPIRHHHHQTPLLPRPFPNSILFGPTSLAPILNNAFDLRDCYSCSANEAVTTTQSPLKGLGFPFHHGKGRPLFKVIRRNGKNGP